MNNRSIIRTFVFLALAIMMLVSCQKDKEIAMASFKILDEVVTLGTNKVDISGSYTYNGKVHGMQLQVKEHSGNFETLAPVTINGSDFSVHVDGLNPQTRYDYSYLVDCGFDYDHVTDPNSFTTKLLSLPTVSTLSVSQIGASEAYSGGIVTSSGGEVSVTRGVCWNTVSGPTIQNNHTVDSCGVGQFVSHLTGLTPSTHYHVRAYATNEFGTSYGEEMEFTTSSGIPVVSTMEVSHVTSSTASCIGNVSSDNGLEITLRGFCYSLSENPTVLNSCVNVDGTLGRFEATLTGLEANKYYHVRAYAINSAGTGYGEDLTFTTQEGLPTVSTGNVTDIMSTSAKCSGNVTNQGASNVTERGICWSTSHNPTTSNSHVNSSDSGLGTYTCTLTGLTPNTTYFVRAYAKNTQGVAYGTEVSFKALDGLPIVITNDPTNITSSSAECGGKVVDQGNSEVQERGICFSTSHNPTIDGQHSVVGSGMGSFTGSLRGLSSNTTYYIRAYAINDQGVAYGEEKSFKTSTGAPSVTTNNVTDITQNSAKCGGNVTSSGGSEVTSRGICWNTAPNPTTNSSHLSSGTGTGGFTVQMTNLLVGTTYYVRAYATNAFGTNYGEQKTFTTTVGLPTVNTNNITNVTQNSATGGGVVVQDGGSSVTERGICWSTSHNPTINGSHGHNGTGTGSFTVQMTSLSPNTTYYVRAYAKNSAGVAYGEEKGFTTLQQITIPTVTTANVTNITQNSATGGGSITNNGGANITQRGICWSTSHNPTINSAHATGSGNNFTVNMINLSANTTYYVRAYAINSAGTGYGNEVHFTTLGGSIGDSWFYNFENSSMTDWTTIDADGDGYNWMLLTQKLGDPGYGHNASNDGVLSQSYDNDHGVLYPDNYLISPRSTISNSSVFSFWACAQDASYAAEHFAVAVSTSGTNPSNFNTIYEHTISAKGERYGGTRGTREQSTWLQYTIDLSSYAGQNVYIAIRHFNCSDQFYLDVDDIRLGTSSGSNEAWLYYGDYDNHLNSWGLTNGGSDEWAVMFPTSTLSPYNGTSITQVRTYIGETGSYTLKIYKGGTSSPSNLMLTHNFTVTSPGWNTINISPLTLSTSYNLWVSISASYNAGIYPKGACQGINNPNARWVNPNGNGWCDVYEDNGNVDICWEIQVWVTNQAKGGRGLNIELPQQSAKQGQRPNSQESSRKP